MGFDPAGSILMTWVSDEENTGNAGTKFLLEKGLIQGDFGLDPEPTSGRVLVRHCGGINVRVTYRSETEHTSLPHPNIDALEKTVNAAQALIELGRKVSYFDESTQAWSKLSVTTDHEMSILSILKDSRLEMRTKTCIVTAKNDWSVLHKMDNLFKDLWNEDSIMQCVQSASAVTIIADSRLKERIIDTVGRFNLIKVRENLVEIAVKSPEKIVDTSGVIAYLITNLSDAGINIEETVSCHTDTIFIVGESDMINAYSVLTKCIQSAEETVGQN